MYRDPTQSNRIKVKAACCLTCLLTLTLCANADEQYYSGGTGEPNDPFQIAAPEDLNDIANHEEHLDKHFILTNDIDLRECTCMLFNVIGDSISPFKGVFDGNHHTISHLVYDSNFAEDIGIFGWVDDSNAAIKYLGIVRADVNVGFGSNAGALVGNLQDGTVTGCWVEDSNVSGSRNIGGLVGESQDGNIFGSFSTAHV